MRQTEDRQRIVIVGAGYAGTIAAIRAAGRTRGRADVVLISPEDVLVQRLRLHELAVGRAVPTPALAKLVGRRPVGLVRGTVTAIDPARGTVDLAGEDGHARRPFDRLIVATGSGADLAVPGVREHAHSCADQASALRLRAALEALPEGSTVAVGGGGLTGIEVVSEVAAARPDLRTRLVSAGPLGGGLSGRARAYLADALARLSVEVVTGARVTAVDARRMVLADGGEVDLDLAVWCGGFRPGALARDSGLAVDGRGAILVDDALRSYSHPQVLAVGDSAAPPPLPNGAAYRPTCQAGMPTGCHAADTVVAELRGEDPKPFDFGYIHQPISLGRGDGLIQFVHRDDTPMDRMLTGRLAARYKKTVSAGAVTGLRMERRFAGRTRWPRAGEPRMEPAMLPA